MNRENLFLVLIATAMNAMTPLLFAAVGGLFTELTGTLNIALEGLIITGAFFGAAAANLSGNIFSGMIAGGLSAALLAAAFGLVTIRLKANVFITGLATNIFAAGMMMVLSRHFFGTKGVIAFNLPPVSGAFPAALRDLPLLGPVVFSHTWIVYASWFFALSAWIVLHRTPFGLRIRATGANPEAVSVSGFSPDGWRLAAFTVSGFACGLAGASLSLPLSAYVPNMSAGRGWIALVAIFLGARRPAGIAAACFVFALAESFSNYAQGVFAVPGEFILAIPYAATLVALVAASVVRRTRRG